jgi:carboxyl-terminal processing protease
MVRKLMWAAGRLLAGFCVAVAGVVAGFAGSVDVAEESLMPTREMREETIYMVRCMEELHLEHKNLSLLDNRAIMLDYLEELDQMKMIFLQGDVNAFVKKFAPTLDIFVSGGSLMPAFNIFDKFRAMAYVRIDWILDRLGRPFDFSKDEVFQSKRKDCGWPQTQEEADVLWEKRLKFEILNEAIGLTKSSEKKKQGTGDGEVAEEPGKGIDVPPAAGNEGVDKTADGDGAYSEDAVKTTLAEATKNIKRRYESWKRSCKDSDSWVVQEMFLNSISKMYDPHTSFLSKDSFDDFTIHIHNSLIGIGAELRDEDGICTINRLTPGGPAQLSGEIKAGDKIVAIAQGDDGDFVDIVGLRLYKTVKLLRGQKNTVVRVKLETVTGDAKVVRLVRDTIKINATRASARYFELERGGKTVRIGMIELPSFYGDGNKNSDDYAYADRDVEILLEALKARGIDGLVLDLRQNGGGLLDQAILITGLFITTGPVVQVKDSFGRIEKLYDNDKKVAWDGPLVILSSSMSASASEILIGALKDHRRALIVGAEATYGKGSVQVALDMNTMFHSLSDKKNLGAAYVTVQKWYLPTGTSTQLKGVPADITLHSLDECFHRREADQPHALGWDMVPPAEFDDDNIGGVTDSLVETLRERSRARQDTLEEFRILRERIDHFDAIVNRNEIPLKISTRLGEKRREERFRKGMDDRVEELEKTRGYPCQPIRLPDVVDQQDSPEDDRDRDDVDSIAIFDTNLRECLRITADWVTAIDGQKFTDGDGSDNGDGWVGRACNDDTGNDTRSGGCQKID